MSNLCFYYELRGHRYFVSFGLLRIDTSDRTPFLLVLCQLMLLHYT